jgi:hypothetical protein
MDWTSILGNVASGGVLGLLGTAFGEAAGYFRRKQEHSQFMERTKLEGELTAAKTSGDIAVARERGAAEAFTESQRAESALRGEHRWVTSFRAFTRPGLTWMALLFTFFFGICPPTTEPGITLAMTVGTYSGMMIAWWFGQRAVDKTSMRFGNSTASAAIQTK